MRPTLTNQGKRKKESVSAKQVVDSLLGALGFDPDKFALFDMWDRETKGLIRGCEAVALQGTRLCVRVPSVIHRQELYYSKDRLIKKLNQAMGRKAITDIRFELSPGSQNREQGGPLQHGNPIGKRNRSTRKKHD